MHATPENVILSVVIGHVVVVDIFSRPFGFDATMNVCKRIIELNLMGLKTVSLLSD